MVLTSHIRRMIAGFALAASLGAALPALAQSGQSAALLRTHADAGTLAEVEKLLAGTVAANAADAEARAALGFAKFARTVEKLGQSLYRHGLRPPTRGGLMLPVLRFPVPENPNPEALDYAKMRAIYATLLADLAEVDRTLANLPPGEFKLKLNLTAINLDLNGDGRGGARESLGAIVTTLMEPPGRRRRPGQPAPDLAFPPINVSFDRADAIWLQGYARLLSAFGEFVLAHDWQDAFNATAQLFFPRVDGGLGISSFLRNSPNLFTGGSGAEESSIADLVAFIHMLRFNVVEPERMKRVRAHLLEMVKLSRLNWKEILAETDDEEEWVPSPKQKSSVFGSGDVTEAVVKAWHETLDEFEAVLEGRLLLGHWRFEKGIDLKQVFEAPRTFDFVLWMMGHAAVPYLKEGPTTSAGTVNEWQRKFGGNFMGFALWFN